jgi:hypothetical protein
MTAVRKRAPGRVTSAGRVAPVGRVVPVGRTALWTPAELGGSLAAWWRGDQVVLASGAVSQWTDLSGNARHWTQGTPANRPGWEAAGVGGQPCLTFNGVDQILSGPSFATLTTSASFFIVMRLVNDPALLGFGACWQLCGPTGDEDYCPFSNESFPGDHGRIFCGVFSTARKSTAVAMGTDFFESPRVFSVKSAASEWRMSIDGVQRYTTSTNTFSSAGAANALGGDPEAALRYHGRFAEGLVCSPALSASNEALVVAYLGARYGIAV